MRQLQLEAMFHLIWALWHAIQFLDGPEELFEISRSNLQQLPKVFMEFVESLDPSLFWDTEEGKGLQGSSVDKLAAWNDYLDGYMAHQSEWPLGVLFVAQQHDYDDRL